MRILGLSLFTAGSVLALAGVAIATATPSATSFWWSVGSKEISINKDALIFGGHGHSPYWTMHFWPARLSYTYISAERAALLEDRSTPYVEWMPKYRDAKQSDNQNGWAWPRW